MKPIVRALLLVGALGVGGCGNGAASSTTPDNKADEGDQEEEVSDEGKKWGGWRWRGKRDDCFFVHNNKCYNNLEKACDAARCDVDDCTTEGGGPAKIVCKE